MCWQERRTTFDRRRNQKRPRVGHSFRALQFFSLMFLEIRRKHDLRFVCSSNLLRAKISFRREEAIEGNWRENGKTDASRGKHKSVKVKGYRIETQRRELSSIASEVQTLLTLSGIVAPSPSLPSRTGFATMACRRTISWLMEEGSNLKFRRRTKRIAFILCRQKARSVGKG